MVSVNAVQREISSRIIGRVERTTTSGNCASNAHTKAERFTFSSWSSSWVQIGDRNDEDASPPSNALAASSRAVMSWRGSSIGLRRPSVPEKSRNVQPSVGNGGKLESRPDDAAGKHCRSRGYLIWRKSGHASWMSDITSMVTTIPVPVPQGVPMDAPRVLDKVLAGYAKLVKRLTETPPAPAHGGGGARVR